MYALEMSLSSYAKSSISVSLANSRGIQLDESIDKILNQYIQAFLPNLSQVKEFQPGPAEACRRIDAQSTQVTRWRSWPEKSKEYVKNILEYNEEDCRATWLLGKKLGNVNDNKNKA